MYYNKPHHNLIDSTTQLTNFFFSFQKNVKLNVFSFISSFIYNLYFYDSFIQYSLKLRYNVFNFIAIVAFFYVLCKNQGFPKITKLQIKVIFHIF